MTSIDPQDSQIVKKIHLRVKSDPNASNEVISWFEALNRPPIPNEEVWWHCKTALKEGFDNVIDYAHSRLPKTTPIDVEAIRFAQRIEIRIWDYGPPFDLLSKLKEMPSLDDNRGDHGRGLKLMERMTDLLQYIRTEDQRNCLIIVKKY